MPAELHTTLTPDTPVRYLKGVGPKTAERFEKLGILTLSDLLCHYPCRYLDFSKPYSIAEAPADTECVVKAEVFAKPGGRILPGGRRMERITAGDDVSSLEITWFNNPYAAQKLELGQEYYFQGIVTGGMLRRQMVNPQVRTDAQVKSSPFEAVYPQTEGLTSSAIAKCVRQLLPHAELLPDPLPSEMLKKYRLLSKADAVRAIHCPATEEEAFAARRRLIYEELLVLQLGIGRMKNHGAASTGAPMKKADASPFWESLPFSPTGAQRRAVEEILTDMSGETSMNRLLQGDVGSGKTLVAAAAIWAEPDEVSGAFGTMLSQPGTMTIWMIVAVLLSFGVCVLGLQKGVEKITKVMMLLLLILIVVLAVHSLVLPNASEGVKFYMVPNLDAIKSRGLGPVIFDAMTHAFFTLSVGIGAMEIFGSYLKKDRTIGGEAVNIILIDTFVALMAGFIIIPACFAYGVAPGAGPSLLFITLPNIFNHMAGGRIWGTAFFVFMSFAALSTVIAVFENIIAFYIDLKGFSRKKVVAGNVIFMILLSLPAVLGFNKLAAFQPIGPGSSIMDLEDFLVSYNLLPLGSMIFVLFCTKKNGWGWECFRKEANEGKGPKLPEWLRFYMSYILPAIIVVVYLKGYYDTFKPRGTGYLVGWMIFACVLLLAIFGIANYKKKDA